MIEQIKTVLADYDGEWKEKKGIWEFRATIAERKAFLSTKKLSYVAKVRIDDDAKEIKFTEMLEEKGSGLSSGGYDGEMSSGFGFQAQSYNTMKGGREGDIEEQSNLFGKKLDYKFKYQEIREKIEALAGKGGYKFSYQITSLGL